MRFNPFRPNGIVPAHMFCGREQEMQIVRQCLYQTKNENPQNFLFEGERGIGKSSLVHYIGLEASPAVKEANDFKFLVVSVELKEAMTPGDLVHVIASEFRTQLGLHRDAITVAQSAWDFLTNWKVLGVEYKKGQVTSLESEVIDDLARTMARFTDGSAQKLNVERQIDGILVLLDEADKPPESARLGEFLKLFTERLTKIGCNRVCFGLTGLPAVISKLRGSHESSLRLFETMPVGVLSQPACQQVVRGAIQEANARNGDKCSITDDALELIADLSDGYPHFVQQFGASAFSFDTDGVIDDDDVFHGAFDQHGALDQIAKRFFHDWYFEQIWSADYRRVLHTMTNHLDGWVSRSEILAASGVKASQVNNALHTLKEKGIILLNAEKKGEYRLPSKSFAVWLKAMEKRSDPGIV